MGKTELDRQHWLMENRCRADDALRALLQAKRQACSDYDDRIRAIKSFSEALYLKAADAQQSELFDPDEVLSPALIKILASPLAGLQ